MPDPAEFCEVICGGRRIKGWTSVQVTRDFESLAATFNLIATDDAEKATDWGALWIKPTDRVQVFLAGTQVINGIVYIRQASMTAQSRAVMLQGGSNTAELVLASHVAKGGQYRQYSFSQIANAVTAPFGIKFKWASMPPEAEKPFRDPQTFPGETCFSLLERLARQRGIKLHDDKEGNLIGDDHNAPSSQSATLEEGKNILSIVAVFDTRGPSSLGFIGQQKGSDDVFGKAASQVRAEASDPSIPFYRPLLVVAEEPSNQSDLQSRANREMEERRWAAFSATVVVQGWHTPNGGLWDIGQSISLCAPSVIPTADGRAQVKIQTVTYAQDARGGTTTTLVLVRDLRGGGSIGKLPSGAAPNVMSSIPTKAEPVA